MVILHEPCHTEHTSAVWRALIRRVGHYHYEPRPLQVSGTNFFSSRVGGRTARVASLYRPLYHTSRAPRQSLFLTASMQTSKGLQDLSLSSFSPYYLTQLITQESHSLHPTVPSQWPVQEQECCMSFCIGLVRDICRSLELLVYINVHPLWAIATERRSQGYIYQAVNHSFLFCRSLQGRNTRGSSWRIPFRTRLRPRAGLCCCAATKLARVAQPIGRPRLVVCYVNLW